MTSSYARFRGRRQVLVGAALTVFGLGLASCAYQGRQASRPALPTPVSSPAAPSFGAKLPPGSPVKAALLLPLSGEHAELGRGMLRAAEMAAAQAGAANLQVVAFDTRGTPEGAADAIDRAIAADAKIVLGPLFSAEVKAVRHRAAAARVNVIAFSNDPIIAGGNVYLLSFLPRQQIDSVMGYAAREGRTRVAILAPQNEYGDQIVQLARELAPRHNLSIARVGHYKADTMEVADEIKAFSGATTIDRKGKVSHSAPLDFDAVLIPDGGTKLRMVASLLAYYDVDPDKIRYLGTARWDDRALRRETMLRGGWFAAPHPEPWERFSDRFQQAHKSEPPRVASLAHDAVIVAANLARQPQGIDLGGAAITNPAGFNGLDGAFRFTPDGLSERGLAIIEISREEFKVIGEPAKGFAIPGTH